eukprot:6298898-Ditylum_brightwellii.AAC.1
MSQPHLIQQIIDEVGLVFNTKPRQTPVLSSHILHCDKQAPSFCHHFHYKWVVGKLNFLSKGMHPDLEYAIYQMACFCKDPCQLHGDAIVFSAKYLLGKKGKGLIFDPCNDASMKLFVDADFSGNWCPHTAKDDPSMAKLRTGYFILFVSCPLLWRSSRLKAQGFSTYSTVPSIYHTVIEDNTSTLELACVPKMRPRTKHVNLVYHHFQQALHNGIIAVHPANSSQQIANIWTKPLPQDLFMKFRCMLMKW